jgi:methionyl-tRNA formyltransferase
VRLNIDRVQPAMSSYGDDSTPPGTVLRADRQLVIRTGDGAIEILELQPAGKRTMQAEEFLRGNRVRVGECLGKGQA